MDQERKRRALASLKDLATYTGPSQIDPGEGSEALAREGRFDDLARDLSDPMKRFYQLRFVNGYSLVRTANALGLSRQTARTLQCKLTAWLVQALK